MRKVLIASSALALVGCGSFNLGYVQPQAGKSQEQQQLATMVCKDQAYAAANSAERQVGSFLLGFTVVGTPLAYEADKSKQREVFAQCMQAKGYKVLPADGEATQQHLAIFDKVNYALPAGFEPQALSDTQRINGIAKIAVNKSFDVGTILILNNPAAVNDVPRHVETIKALQEGALQNPKSTGIAELTINNLPAYRFDTTGTANGVRLTYQVTVLSGKNAIGIVKGWTSADNYPIQEQAITSLAKNVTGI